MLIGLFRENIIQIVLEHEPRKREEIFRLMFKEILRHTIPIRLGRHNKRNKKKNTYKNKLNMRRNS
jgi:hypothetical protein